MPTEASHSEPRHPQKPWLACCGVHQHTPPNYPTLQVQVDGQPQQALLDLGSSISLTRPEALSPDIVRVPTLEVALGNGQHEWLVMLRIVLDLPVPLLLDQNWPGFPEVANDEGESPAPTSNPSITLSQQVLREGSFSQEQKEDKRLKHCWGQGQEVDRWATVDTLPAAYFLVRNGLMYYATGRAV